MRHELRHAAQTRPRGFVAGGWLSPYGALVGFFLHREPGLHIERRRGPPPWHMSTRLPYPDAPKTARRRSLEPRALDGGDPWLDLELSTPATLVDGA